MTTSPLRLLSGLLGLCLAAAPSFAQDTVLPPFGNQSAGTVFDVRAAAGAQPMRLIVKHDPVLLRGLQFEWCGRDMTTSTGLSTQLGLSYSQQGVTTTAVDFAPGEHIRRVDVWAVASLVTMVRIYTPVTSYDFGARATGDARHNFIAATGHQIVGFVGNAASTSLLSLGVVTRPLLASDERFGSACSTSLGSLALRWRPGRAGMVVGQLPIIECPNVPLGSVAWFLYGFSNTSQGGVPLPYNLAPHGSPSCNIYQSIDFSIFGSPDATRVFGHTIDGTSWSPDFVGMNLFLQALILNPNGVLKTSDSLRTVIGLL